jgi:hypothetical protein
LYIFLVHPDRMRKWGLISLDGRWIDFRSLWSRSMSPAITISDRFRSVMSLREFWPAASNPIHPVAHSIPSLSSSNLLYYSAMVHRPELITLLKITRPNES